MPNDFNPDRPTMVAAITRWMQGLRLSPSEQLVVEYAQVVTVARALAVRP